MPALNLPVTEVVKALDIRTYSAMLAKWVLDCAGTLEGALKCDDQRYLAKSVCSGVPLTPGQIADMHLDGDLMAGFVHWFVAEVPMEVMSAFTTGWDETSRQRGRDLAALLVSTAASLPEGPFFYILATLSQTGAWRGNVYSSHPKEMDAAEKNWDELFSGRINALIERAPDEGNPYLKLAGERLKELALLAHDTPGGKKMLERSSRERSMPPDAYTLGRLAELALIGRIELVADTSLGVAATHSM